MAIVQNIMAQLSFMRMQKQRERGFSLVELMTVLGIFVVITTIGLVSFSQFNSQTLLNSLAYEVALSIREAQSFGLSVRDAGSGFDTGYGIYFDASESNAYILFADTNRNFVYNGDMSCTTGTECVERITIGTGYMISDICVVTATGDQCSSTGDLTYLSTIFDRPEPDAILRSNAPGVYEEAYLVLSSVRGNEQRVHVFTTGQISVGN